ncbi:toll/interleukin-1 receptor domain-containing protein [Roseibium sp.]|uniref:toll/interleukin-1 receptor domain-containing protein n=1 Tax=Roseibium sp. TaxID=1936156 RepID=UPI003A96E728
MSDALTPPEHAEGEDQPKVFVSYSRKDREKAHRISKVLADRNLGVFRDTEDILPTEEWRDRLEQLIREADTIIFLLSPASATSEVCAWEIELAHQLEKRIAPIVIEDVPGEDIPPILARLNFIFCTDRDPFEDAVDSVVSAVNTDIDWIREHTRLAGLARRWRQSGERRSLLLRGADIADAERWRDERVRDAPQITPDQTTFITESRRNAQRQQKLTLALSLAAVVVGLALAATAFWQRSVALTQRNDALKAQSLYLADLSQEALARGDTTMAILSAIEALPDTSSTDPQQRNRPYVAAARMALTEAMAERRELHTLRFPQPTSNADAEFSPDGQRILSSDFSQAVLFDAGTGKQIAVLDFHGKKGSYNIHFSPDGKLITAAYLTANGGGAGIWDGRTGAHLTDLSSGVEITGIAFSPDGNIMAASGTARFDNRIQTAIQLWDAHTFAPIRTLMLKPGLIPARGVTFSKDGKRLLTARGEQIDVATGAAVYTIEGSETKIEQAIFAPDDTEILVDAEGGVERRKASDGSLIARHYGADLGKTARYSPDGSVFIYQDLEHQELFVVDRESSHVRFSIPYFESSPIEHTDFSPDSQYLATASQNGNARVWNLAEKSLVTSLIGHQVSIYDISFSADGRHVLTASEDDTARIWDAATGETVTVLYGHTSDVKKARFSPDGATILTSGYDGTARLWDWRRAANAPAIPESAGASSFLKGGEQIIVGPWGTPERPITIRDSRTGELVKTLPHTSNLIAAANGSIFVSGDYSNATVWDGDTLEKRFSLPGTGWNLRSDEGSLVSSNGHILALAKVDGKFEIRNDKGEVLLEGSHPQALPLAISADDRLVATGDRSGVLRVWDISTGKYQSYEGHKDWIRDAKFTKDGKRIVTASSDGDARVWDLATGESQHYPVEPGKNWPAMRVALSPDGQFAAVGGVSRNLLLINIATNEVAGRFPTESYLSTVHSLKFSPDSKTLAIGFGHGEIRLLDTATGAVVGRHRRHTDHVRDLRFSPDGGLIATSSWDNTVNLLPFWPTLEDLLSAAKETAPRCLTDAERKILHVTETRPEWCGDR